MVIECYGMCSYLFRERFFLDDLLTRLGRNMERLNIALSTFVARIAPTKAVLFYTTQEKKVTEPPYRTSHPTPKRPEKPPTHPRCPMFRALHGRRSRPSNQLQLHLSLCGEKAAIPRQETGLLVSIRPRYPLRPVGQIGISTRQRRGLVD